MINKWTGMGYLASDPEFNKYDSGKRKCNFSIGVTINKNTLWMELECWDKIADNCKKYLTKGSLVFVETHLKTNRWKKNDQNYSKTIAVIDFLKILNLKNEGKKDNNVNSSKNFNIKQIDSISKDIASQQTDDEFAEVDW
tara:strand:+ start:2139 stop:2558 length:420 start_codon:yes stop_codon:yes gene_type:complete